MLWGAGDGIDNFSLYSADVKPDKDGGKVLRMSEFSSKGDLFMAAWDPIGPMASAIIIPASSSRTSLTPRSGPTR